MAASQTLTYDNLLNTIPYLSVEALLNLATTRQALNESLTNAAFEAALTVPFDDDLKPVTYAIKNGDIPLLSRTLAFLDSLHPQGWKWSQFYENGVGRILTLAAAHNLKSLQYLVEKYPLWPASVLEAVPVEVIEHGFYSTETARYVPSLADTRNRELVQSAVQENSYDCAAFLLTQYQPVLFPGGFTLRENPLYYSSTTILEFMIDHNANLGVNPLHDAVRWGNSIDRRVFDILVQKGFSVDSPLYGFDKLSIGSMTTPLNIACERLQPANVESLLRLGANPNGIGGGPCIRKIPFMGGYQYASPHPMLALLLSTQWDILPFDDPRVIGERFILGFESLLRHGAIVPLPNRDFLDILLIKIWKVVCTQIIRRIGFVLPNCPDEPSDRNQGVRSLLCALSDINIKPWGQVFQAVSATNPIWSGNAKQTKGKARLIKFLYDYQEEYGDLPGPAQLRRPSLCVVPDRYSTQLNSC
ncbi:hypothetical protein F5Y12DRAFT_745032 [Xylaria sp. FL1777]|nr:hypothetical protein F5Y12DRAFT_745032 [Xylaria sp. FL1777]